MKYLIILIAILSSCTKQQELPTRIKGTLFSQYIDFNGTFPGDKQYHEAPENPFEILIEGEKVFFQYMNKGNTGVYKNGLIILDSNTKIGCYEFESGHEFKVEIDGTIILEADKNGASIFTFYN